MVIVGSLVSNIVDAVVNTISDTVGGLWTDFSLWYQISQGIWDALMDLSKATLGLMPSSFSMSSNNYVLYVVWPFFLTYAATLVNIFFYIGLCRQLSNLKQNMTLEIMIEYFIRVLAANFLLMHGRTYINKLTTIAGGFVDELQSLSTIDMSIGLSEADLGSAIFMFFFGFIYFLVAVISAGTIALTVYSRFVTYYLHIAVGPMAISTIPGGPGISSTFTMWLKSFLGKTFAIVVMAIVFIICSKLLNGIDFMSNVSSMEAYDGVFDCINNMLTMVLFAAAIKGTDSFMKSTLGL